MTTSTSSDLPFGFNDTDNLVEYRKFDCKDEPDFVADVKQEILDEEASQFTETIKVEKTESLLTFQEAYTTEQFIPLDNIKTGIFKEEVPFDELEITEVKVGLGDVEASASRLVGEDEKTLNHHQYTSQLIQKRKRSTEAVKCFHCGYETIYKDSLKRHLLIHQNSQNIELFKCDQCQFKTIHRNSLKVHHMRHQRPANLLSCAHCTFQTIHKHSLKGHLFIHKDTEEGAMLKCEHCPYETNRKSNLNFHLRLHRPPGEVEEVKCSKCTFKTSKNTYLQRHMQRHKLQEEGDLTCSHCEFRTSCKEYLTKHLRLRHGDQEKVPRFKCEKCDYETKRKYDLQSHYTRHLKLRDAGAFKCTRCASTDRWLKRTLTSTFSRISLNSVRNVHCNVINNPLKIARLFFLISPRQCT